MAHAARLILISLLLALALEAASGAWARAVPSVFERQSRESCKTTNVDCARFSYSSSAPVSLHVAAGYDGHYRDTAWVPVHITLQNRGYGEMAGDVIIPDHGRSSQYANPEYDSLYEMPVTLQPGETQQVTLYIPGNDIATDIEVNYRAGGKIIASARTSPSTFDDGAINIGTLTSDSALVSWLRTIQVRNASVDLTHFSAATLDSMPEALANFDAIVVSNVDTSRLDGSQMTALEGYVQQGGSLLLIGGPDWQETLRPLPASLIPGVLQGSRTISHLTGLRALSRPALPWQATVVSVLGHPRGSVVASESGLPLVVRNTVGQGRIIYVGFDPAIDPISRWSGAARFLTELVQQATPQVAARLSASSGVSLGGSRFRFGPTTIVRELANVPSATQPSLLLLFALIAVSILVLGPLTFLVLTSLRRRDLAWLVLPGLALFFLFSTLFLASRLKGEMSLVNTASVVELNGNSTGRSATVYAGLFAPVRGDYRLVWHGTALVQGLPQYSFSDATKPSVQPVGVRLEQSAPVAVDFPAMAMWSTRSVALRTAVSISGGIVADLYVSADGSIAGSVRNDTNLTLRGAAIVAGDAFLRLPDLSPQTTRFVHLSPYADLSQEELPLLWDHLYGPSSSNGGFGSWDGDPWEEPDPAAEKSFRDRLRNVAERLPEARDVISFGETLFVGWSERPLGALTVDGSTPVRRDLNLLIAPLAVHLRSGPFRLRQGTLGATLVDVTPAAPIDGCCPSALARDPIALGPGGSATFQFDIPGGNRVHFRRLSLAVNASGADSTQIGQVYDWRTERWVHIDVPATGAALPEPDRFVSPTGALLMRLQATAQSGDIVINDPHQDLQLSGRGTAR